MCEDRGPTNETEVSRSPQPDCISAQARRRQTMGVKSFSLTTRAFEYILKLGGGALGEFSRWRPALESGRVQTATRAARFSYI